MAGIIAVLGAAALARADIESNDKDDNADKAWLGIVMASGSHGVLVSEVVPLSPAETAGIEVGDQIFELDGQTVGSYVQLKSIIQNRAVGDRVAIKVWRDGGKRTLYTKLSRFLTKDEMLFRRLVNSPPRKLTATLAYGSAGPDLDQYLGDIVLVGFWGRGQSAGIANWMNELANEHADKGLVVMAVSSLSERALAPWADAQNLSFSILADTDSKTHENYRIGYNNDDRWVKPPAFVLVDRDGLVRYAGRLAGKNDCVSAIITALEERNGLALE